MRAIAPLAPAGARSVATSATDGALELRLVHLRAALDVGLGSLGVELVVGPAALAAVRAQAAAPLGRQVVERGPARRLALAVLRPILVDGARRDLLGGVLVLAALLEAFLDVLVLALALGAPLIPGHGALLEEGFPRTGNCNAGTHRDRPD